MSVILQILQCDHPLIPVCTDFDAPSVERLYRIIAFPDDSRIFLHFFLIHFIDYADLFQIVLVCINVIQPSIPFRPVSVTIQKPSRHHWDLEREKTSSQAKFDAHDLSKTFLSFS